MLWLLPGPPKTPASECRAQAGRGIRLFGTARADLRCTEVIQGEGAAHLRYEIR